MFQYFFDKEKKPLFEHAHPPELTRFVISNDPQWSSGYHLHKNELELIYVAKGKAHLTLESSHYDLQEGDIAFIEPGNIHTLSSDHNHPVTTWACAITNFQIKGLRALTLSQPDTCPVTSLGAYHALIRGIFDSIHNALESNEQVAIQISNHLASILATTFYEIFKDSPRKKITSSRASSLKHVMIFLNDNYNQKITIENLAQQFHLSESYLCHNFKKEYHISPIRYVITRRITEAKMLLANSNQNLSAIAEKIGYDNVEHFIKLFIKYVGCTPSQYHQQHKNTT